MDFNIFGKMVGAVIMLLTLASPNGAEVGYGGRCEIEVPTTTTTTTTEPTTTTTTTEPTTTTTTTEPTTTTTTTTTTVAPETVLEPMTALENDDNKFLQVKSFRTGPFAVPPELKCDESLWLECDPTNGICGCQRGLIYTNQSCSIPAGADCITNALEPKCVDHAECKPTSSEQSKCLCFEEFVDSLSGVCLLGYHQSCQLDSQCSLEAYLVCSFGVCECDNPLTQLWSQEEKKCLSLLGAYCDNQEDGERWSRSCIPNAKCNDSSCACEDGFLPRKDDYCAVDFGGNCSSVECDEGYSCNGGICDCRDDEIYDEITEACTVKAGEPCKGNRNCVQNATCDIFTNTCTCQSEYLIRDDQICGASYGAFCFVDEAQEDICGESFPEKLLVCDEEKNECVCKPRYEYKEVEPGEPRCWGLLRADCFNDTDCYSHTCSEQNECVCGEDYVVSPATGEECFRIYGASCDGSQINCNPYEFLTCSNNICTCEDSENNIYVGGHCLALPMSKCMTRSEDFKQRNCFENSKCIEVASESLDGICICDDGFIYDESTRRCVPLGDNGATSVTNSIGFVIFFFATKTVLSYSSIT